jgi:hypothetical protein
MNLLVVLLACCVLWVLCWPLLIVAIVLFPLVWLISIPFRIVGIVVEAMLALIKGLLFLPARILGGRKA